MPVHILKYRTAQLVFLNAAWDCVWLLINRAAGQYPDRIEENVRFAVAGVTTAQKLQTFLNKILCILSYDRNIQTKMAKDRFKIFGGR
jgi:hypothetical protein